jgi:hypothetical protein
MRQKMVAFFRRYELYLKTNDPKTLGYPGPVMTDDNLEDLKIKRTLFASVKRLLRVVIVTDDPALQQKYLVKLKQWYQVRENAMITIEAANTARLR